MACGVPRFQNIKFNQYVPAVLTSRIVSNSRFRKLIMFWMWHYHGMTLWRHGGGAWHNALFLKTAPSTPELTLLTTSNDPNEASLWQAGDMENFHSQITGKVWAVKLAWVAQSCNNLRHHTPQIWGFIRVIFISFVSTTHKLNYSVKIDVHTHNFIIKVCKNTVRSYTLIEKCVNL